LKQKVQETAHRAAEDPVSIAKEVSEQRGRAPCVLFVACSL